ncbi:MAG: methyltransferase domain-containing protein, partial [Gammaproteobacteria bacterium]
AGIEAWSVGCSIGAEAYTLAMLLLDQEPARSHRVWGVDIDTKVLERAIAGGPYTRSEVKELPPHFLQKYMQVLDDNSYMVRPSVRTITNFQHFDLLQDVVERQFDLILCRNVVIYFTAQTKVDVYRRLRQALRPGGVLFIGSTETISRYREWGLEYIAPAFYRRKR